MSTSLLLHLIQLYAPNCGTFSKNINLHQTIHTPTTDNYTIIDHIRTNIRLDLLISHPLESYFIDHEPLFLTLLTTDLISTSDKSS